MADDARTPKFDPTLPYDRTTLNSWIRYYVLRDPVVAGFVEHGARWLFGQALPGRRYEDSLRFGGTTDPEVLRMFQDDLLARPGMSFAAHAKVSFAEYTKFGETYTFWEWDAKACAWEFVVLNPDDIEVLPMPMDAPSYRFVGHPTIREVVREAIASAEIDEFLDPTKITKLVRRVAPYDVRGTSRIAHALANLIYRDRLRDAAIELSKAVGVDDAKASDFDFKLLDRLIVMTLVRPFGVRDCDLFHWLQEGYATIRQNLADEYRRVVLRPFAEARKIRVPGTGETFVPTIEWPGALDLRDPDAQIIYADSLARHTMLALSIVYDVLSLDAKLGQARHGDSWS